MSDPKQFPPQAFGVLEFDPSKSVLSQLKVNVELTYEQAAGLLSAHTCSPVTDARLRAATKARITKRRLKVVN